MLKVLNSNIALNKIGHFNFNRLIKSKINIVQSIEHNPINKLDDYKLHTDENNPKILIKDVAKSKGCLLPPRTVSIIEDLVIMHILLAIFAFISLSVISYVCKKFNL
jgi:hypothetical protein